MLTVTAFDHLVPDVGDSEAPHEAMLFSSRGLCVAVIEPDDTVSMRDVTIARDF